MWGNLPLLRTLSRRRPSHSTATVDVMIQSSQPREHEDAFDVPGIESTGPLLVTSTIDCFQSVETDEGRAYRGLLEPSARVLEAEREGTMPLLQIGVNPAAEAPAVVTGTVKITVNAAVRITVSIQPQAMQDNKILVKDVSGVVALLQ
jgi:hypothetical protein